MTPQNAPATNLDTSETGMLLEMAVTVLASVKQAIAVRMSGLRRRPPGEADARGCDEDGAELAQALMN